MARFSYVAIDSKGKTLPGEITGDDAKEARLKLRQKGLTPIQINLIGGQSPGKAKGKQKKVTKAKKQAMSGTKKRDKCTDQHKRTHRQHPVRTIN